MKDALANQVGGGHYKGLAIQPVEYIHANQLGYIEGCVVKYISRWKSKGGVQDLEKIKHYCDLLIQLETEGVPAITRKLELHKQQPIDLADAGDD